MKFAREKSSPWNRKLWPAHNLNISLSWTSKSLIFCTIGRENPSERGQTESCLERNLIVKNREILIYNWNRCEYALPRIWPVWKRQEKPSPAPLNCDTSVGIGQAKCKLLSPKQIQQWDSQKYNSFPNLIKTAVVTLGKTDRKTLPRLAVMNIWAQKRTY